MIKMSKKRNKQINNREGAEEERLREEKLREGRGERGESKKKEGKGFKRDYVVFRETVIAAIIAAPTPEPSSA
jgi:hypothetical protein